MSLTLLDKWRLAQAVVADPELSGSAKCVGFALLTFVNPKTEACYPSYPALGKRAGLKRRATIYAVQELDDNHWIAIERTPGGKNNTNRFRVLDRPSTVHDHAPIEGSETVHGDAPSEPSLTSVQTVHQNAQTVHDMSQTVHTCAHEQVKKTSRLKGERGGVACASPSARPAGALEAQFLSFWHHYPKHDGENGARREFVRVVSTGQAKANDLIQGAMRYAAERDGQRVRFTKRASSWLEDGDWKNAPKEPDPTNPPRRRRASEGSALDAFMARHCYEEGEQ